VKKQQFSVSIFTYKGNSFSRDVFFDIIFPVSGVETYIFLLSLIST